MNTELKAELQAMFNVVYIGLASQEFKQSKVSGSKTTCAYRGVDGRKCAAGWLLPDDKYKESLECRSVGYFSAERVEELFGISRKLLVDLSYLQAIHDESNSPEHMRSGLDRYAASKKLTIPQV